MVDSAMIPFLVVAVACLAGLFAIYGTTSGRRRAATAGRA